MWLDPATRHRQDGLSALCRSRPGSLPGCGWLQASEDRLRYVEIEQNWEKQVQKIKEISIKRMKRTMQLDVNLMYPDET